MDGISILENNFSRNLTHTPKLLARMFISIYNHGMNQSGLLYRLQRIDSQISQVTTRITEIDRLLSEDERLIAARSEAEAARVRLEKSRNVLRSSEHAVSEQQLKIEQTNSTLYSGTVKNPKELQDLQKDVVSLNKHLQTLEDLQLQAMIEVEEAEQTHQTAQENLTRVQAEVIQSKASLSGERDQLKTRRENLAAERLAALPSITAGNLSIYDHLREIKGGVAVTSVEDDACTLCGAPIRPGEGQMARMHSNLMYCSSCGRIVFAG